MSHSSRSATWSQEETMDSLQVTKWCHSIVRSIFNLQCFQLTMGLSELNPIISGGVSLKKREQALCKFCLMGPRNREETAATGAEWMKRDLKQVEQKGLSRIWNQDPLEGLSRGFYHLTYCFNTAVNKLQATRPPPAFVNNFIITQLHSFLYILSIVAIKLQL